MADPIPQAYADCIHLHCRNCHADPGRYCHNPVTKLARGTPCWLRNHDADIQARDNETRTETKDFK